jgi:hypothetical protein
MDRSIQHGRSLLASVKAEAKKMQWDLDNLEYAARRLRGFHGGCKPVSEQAHCIQLAMYALRRAIEDAEMRLDLIQAENTHS